MPIASCLAKELDAYQLISSVKPDPEQQERPEEAYTLLCLREAATPERIAELKAASLQEWIRRTRDMAMRMSYHLLCVQAPSQAAPAGQELVRSRVEDVADEFVRFCLLMSVTSFVRAQKMCYYNLDTEQPDTPPPGARPVCACDASRVVDGMTGCEAAANTAATPTPAPLHCRPLAGSHGAVRAAATAAGAAGYRV